MIGDLISNSTPLSLMPAVLILAGGRNSTANPAIAKILATRSSCGHGVTLAGINYMTFFGTIHEVIIA